MERKGITCCPHKGPKDGAFLHFHLWAPVKRRDAEVVRLPTCIWKAHLRARGMSAATIDFIMRKEFKALCSMAAGLA